MPRRSTSFRRHGKRWQGSFYDAAGVRHFVTRSTLEAVRRDIADLRSETERARNGLAPLPERLPPVPRLMEEYGQDLTNRCSRPYARMTITRLKRMMEGVVDIRALTPRLMHDRRAAVAGSNRTKNRHVEAVRMWLRWCEDTGRLALAPRVPLKALKTTGEHARRVRRALTVEECKKLLDASDGTPIGPLVALLLGTGLRLRQALGLRWRDYRDGAVHVRADAQGNRKARRALSVPVPSWLASRLTQTRMNAGRLLNRLPTEDDPIVVSPRGLPLDGPGAPERCYRWLAGKMDWRVVNKKRIKVWIGGILEKAGLPRKFPDGTSIDWHALRHTYATMLGASGATGPQIQSLLGHSSLAQASQYVRADRVPTVPAVAALPDLSAPDSATTVPGAGKQA